MSSDVFSQKWIASHYLDDDRCGVLSEDNVIVIGVSVGLSDETCRSIAWYHNEHTLRAEPAPAVTR
jgi:hypothetical protein